MFVSLIGVACKVFKYMQCFLLSPVQSSEDEKKLQVLLNCGLTYNPLTPEELKIVESHFLVCDMCLFSKYF